MDITKEVLILRCHGVPAITQHVEEIVNEDMCEYLL